MRHNISNLPVLQLLEPVLPSFVHMTLLSIVTCCFSLKKLNCNECECSVMIDDLFICCIASGGSTSNIEISRTRNLIFS